MTVILVHGALSAELGRTSSSEEPEWRRRGNGSSSESESLLIAQWAESQRSAFLGGVVGYR